MSYKQMYVARPVKGKKKKAHIIACSSRNASIIFINLKSHFQDSTLQF